MPDRGQLVRAAWVRPSTDKGKPGAAAHPLRHEENVLRGLGRHLPRPAMMIMIGPLSFRWKCCRLAGHS